MENEKKVTFDDIAKYTNFSKTTISRYFNNPDSLTVKNQDIIAQALVDLNYHENKLARVLANGKSEFVGIIVPNLYLHYYAEMLNQILNTYEQFGYKFLIFASNGNSETERAYIQELLAYKIEGMILLSHTIPCRRPACFSKIAVMYSCTSIPRSKRTFPHMGVFRDFRTPAWKTGSRMN